MEKTNKSRFGEKTPSNFWYLDVMLAWYPQAKVIFIVRDPRDVHGSYKNHWLDQKEVIIKRRVAGRALYWNYGIQTLNKAVRKFPGQVMKVFFHTLIQDPAAAVQSVCDFIGEAYHENIIALTNTNTSFDQTTHHSTRGITHSLLCSCILVLVVGLKCLKLCICVCALLCGAVACGCIRNAGE